MPASDPPLFAETSCSQCGGRFGPGNSGFSHCRDHRDRAATHYVTRLVGVDDARAALEPEIGRLFKSRDRALALAVLARRLLVDIAREHKAGRIPDSLRTRDHDRLYLFLAETDHLDTDRIACPRCLDRFEDEDALAAHLDECPEIE